MVTAVMSPHRLRQTLDVGKVAALRRLRKVGGELAELGGSSGIALRLGRLGGVLQLGRNLLCHLFVLTWVRLLKLLEFADHLSEGRQPAAVCRLCDRRYAVGFGR